MLGNTDILDPRVRTLSVEVVVDDHDASGFRAGGVDVHIPGQMVLRLLVERLVLGTLFMFLRT